MSRANFVYMHFNSKGRKCGVCGENRRKREFPGKTSVFLQLEQRCLKLSAKFAERAEKALRERSKDPRMKLFAPLSLFILVCCAPAAFAQAANPAKLFAEGQSALQRGDLNSAEKSFEAVLKLDPKAGAAYTNLGVI